MKYRSDNCLTVGISFTEVANVRENPQISSRNNCNCHEETRKPSNLEYIKFAQLYCTRAPTCCICQKRTQNLEDMKDILSKILDTLTKPSKRCRICCNPVNQFQEDKTSWEETYPRISDDEFVKVQPWYNPNVVKIVSNKTRIQNSWCQIKPEEKLDVV